MADFCRSLFSFSGPSQPEEEAKEKGERRHSHTVLSMTDSLTLPLLSSPTSLPRTSKTNMGLYQIPANNLHPSSRHSTSFWLIFFYISAVTTVPSPVGGPNRMTRSNSIPTHDASMELYSASPPGSTMSLAERPRSMGMVRSGSFREREPNDEGEALDYFSGLFINVIYMQHFLNFVSLNVHFPVHGSVLSLASNASSSYSSVSVGSVQNQVDTD